MRVSRWVYAAVVLPAVFVWLWFFPPRWWLNLTKPIDLTDPVSAGAVLIEKYECRRCHLIDGSGKPKAPDLAEVTTRLDSVSLRLWLRDPSAIRWRTIMPNFNLSDGEIEAIVAYLTAYDERTPRRQ